MKYRFFILTIVLSLVSCGLWKEQPAPSSPDDVTDAKKRAIPALYVHTGPEFSRQSLLDPLVAEYGRTESGGLISVFTSVKELEELPYSAVVLTVGSDSGIIRPLSRLAGSRNDLRIISLFSLDDPVLLEYFSELVLDIALSGELLTPESETRGLPLGDREVSVLLVALVRSLEFRDWNKTRPEQLREQLDYSFRALGYDGVPNTWTLQHYLDPETGIRSRNHVQLSVQENS